MSEAMISETIPCPYCDGDAGWVFARFMRPYYRCSGCSLVFSTELDEAEKYEGYADHFSSEWKGEGREAVFAEVLSQLADHKFGSLLDVGCGGGLLLNMAREEGWQVRGVEPSMGENTWMYDGVRSAVVKDISGLGEDRFDVVVSVNVMDQVPEAWRFLSALAARLERGGLLVIRIPNCRLHRWLLQVASMLPEAMGYRLQSMTIMHGYGLERSLLMRMFSDAGLEDVHILPSMPSVGDVYGQGGSVLWLKRLFSALNRIVGWISFGRLVITPSILIVARKA